MKKTILLSVFGLLNLLAFTQEKHITYAKPISINTGYYLDYFKVAASTNFDGYFLATKFDDMSYLMKHYVAKTDFKGDVIWDTVYYFQEPNTPYSPQPIHSVISTNNDLTVASEASGTNTNARIQPFIYNIDNTGNINWNAYYGIDTINFENTNIIKTNSGGYVLFGAAVDYSGSGLSTQYGYAYKVDALGSLMWSKFYADKDTSEFTFSAGDATSDNKYIFAGNANNQKSGGGKLSTPNPYDHFMNVVCVDINGDVLWNSALYFDAPVDNGLNFQVKSVNVIDLQTVLVSFSYYNLVTLLDEYGLASINIVDGTVNWVNGYSLATSSSSLYLHKVVKKKNGNIIVTYDDNTSTPKSDLLELDYNGNIIQNKTIQEFAESATYFHDIVTTDDGGLFVVANLNSGTGVLTFKTDKDLFTSCPEEYQITLPDVMPLVFDVYNILDTTFDVSPIVGSLVPMAEPEITTTLGFPCSCELSMYGTVRYAGVVADSVLVTIYRYDVNPGKYIVLDTILTNSDGNYQFNYLPKGDYIIKAEPSTLIYPDYLPTYYLLTGTTTQWNNAMVVNVACGSNPISYDVDLVQKLPQTGSWTCSGYVLEYYGYNAGTNKAAGEPIPDIDITIDQSPGGSVSSATTDNSGYFEFTGLDNNATFVVKADIPGLPNDSIYTFTVNPGDGPLDSLNFYIDTVGVYILPEYILTGLNVIKSKNVNVNIVPNPTNANFILEINAEVNSTMKISLSNSIGQVIFNKNLTLNMGGNKIQFDIKDYPSGIYYMNISNENDHFIKKIVKL